MQEKVMRENRKISLRKAAIECGIPHKTLSAWKNQKVSQFSGEVVLKLCDYLDCEVGELLVIDANSEVK